MFRWQFDNDISEPQIPDSLPAFKYPLYSQQIKGDGLLNLYLDVMKAGAVHKFLIENQSKYNISTAAVQAAYSEYYEAYQKYKGVSSDT